MGDVPNQNGWNEYSRLVLKELESLADNIGALQVELGQVRQEIAKLQVKEDKVDELRAWKEKIDEVASPTQLQTALKEIEDLKMYKTKAVTVFAVIQFAMAASIFISKWL